MELEFVFVLKAVCDISAVVVMVMGFMFVTMGVISVGVAVFDTMVSVIKMFCTLIIHPTRCVYLN